MSYKGNAAGYRQVLVERLAVLAQGEEWFILDLVVTPSPHNPLGAKGMGESPTIAAPPAIANAVVDALAHLGVTHVDISIKAEKVWRILRDKGVATSCDPGTCSRG